MEFKVKTHQQVSPEQWDQWVNQIDESTYLHDWNWLQYCGQFKETGSQDSFILLENERTALAVCPLGITVDAATGKKTLALGGNPLAAPAIVTIQPTLRRKIMAEVFERIYQYAQSHGAEQILLKTHPLNHGLCKGTLIGSENYFEMKKFGLFPDVQNAAVINLSLTEETLLNHVSRSHRIHLRDSAKLGLTVKAYAGNEEHLEKYFNEFKNAHFKSAGRWTRPQSTWQTMLDRAKQNKATLFVASANDQAVSYLFCGEYSKMVVSWSQANLEEFEREYSPRHTIEWAAILHYKNKGFKFYELGDLFFGPHWTYHASKKETNIGEFKELFGGSSFPKTVWHGFLSSNSARQFLEPNLKVYEKYLFTGKPTTVD